MYQIDPLFLAFNEVKEGSLNSSIKSTDFKR